MTATPNATDQPATVPIVPPPFQFTRLAAAGITHGITRRVPGLHRDGDLSFVTGAADTAVFASRQAWAAAIGFDPADVVAARQVHAADVTLVTGADRGRGARTVHDALPATDALLTDEPGVPLLMCFADCAPLLFHDPVRRVVGLAHAGWRGAVADIAGATVRAMARQYGSAPRDIRAGIGPAIGPCCYVVGDEVVAAWEALGVPGDGIVRAEPDRASQWRFDLPGANRMLLQRAGLGPDQIEDAATCTACHVAGYFSHRAEHGQAGRFAAVIALAPSTYP